MFVYTYKLYFKYLQILILKLIKIKMLVKKNYIIIFVSLT